MLVTTLLKLQPVFIDTAIFIYLFEDHPKYASIIQPVFDMLSTGKLNTVTSIFTVAEVLTRPIEEKDNELVKHYQEIFTQIKNLSVATPNYSVSIKAAEIRAQYKFGLIDSFQLALASEYKCGSFFTNDFKLKKCTDLKIILP